MNIAARHRGSCCLACRSAIMAVRRLSRFLRPAAFPPLTSVAADRTVLFGASSALCGRPTPHLFRRSFNPSVSHGGPGTALSDCGQDEVSQLPTRSFWSGRIEARPGFTRRFLDPP
jgi:hypothetical protein